MIIQSKRVYYDEKLQPLQLKIEDGKIVDIYAYGQFKANKDYKDNIIMPGLIDVHNHGYNLGDNNHATKKWLKEWTSYLPSEGVTSTLSTISSNPKDGLLKALKNIGEYIDEKHEGTNILGVYEEGPFISSGKERGAQEVAFQIIPTKKVIDEFNNACNGHLIYVMMAPEMLKGKYDVIDYCRSKGMTVSLGHTGATFDICSKAIEHGARSFTHTYNGMKGLHHREPGVVGAAMFYDECYAECIADNVHVANAAANALAKAKGKDKLIIVTDSISLKGLPVGRYVMKTGQVRLVCEDNVSRLENGTTLSGSCNKLNLVLRNAIKNAKIPMVTAFNAVTINPMRMLGIKNKGLIERGYDADIAVFDDEFNTKATYIGGKLWSK